MALGILGISMAALMDGTLLATSAKLDVRNVTRATLVARSVMGEIEQKLIRDGFGAFEKTEACDFRIDGLKEFHCEYQVRKVDLPIGEMIQRLMTVGGGGLANAVGGLTGGGASSSSSSSTSMGSSPLGGLGALAAGGPSALSGLMGGGGGGGGGAGLAGNAIQLFSSQMEAMLEEALREVRLTLSWKIGRKTWDSMTVVTHVVEIARAGVTAQDQASGQISKAGGLQAPVPGQGGAPGMPGFTGTASPLPPNVSITGAGK